jgi:hypothetical protein
LSARRPHVADSIVVDGHIARNGLALEPYIRPFRITTSCTGTGAVRVAAACAMQLAPESPAAIAQRAIGWFLFMGGSNSVRVA